MNQKLKNKKGIVEIITVIVILLVVAIGFVAVVFVGLKVNDTLGPKISELSAESGDNISYNAMNSTITKTVDSANYLFLALFVLLVMSLVITSFLFFSHPIFLVAYIILAVGALIVSAPISNVYEKVSQIGVFNESVAKLTIPSYIMLHLPVFVLGLIVITIIIIYAKSQSGGTIFGGSGMSQM